MEESKTLTYKLMVMVKRRFFLVVDLLLCRVSYHSLSNVDLFAKARKLAKKKKISKEEARKQIHDKNKSDFKEFKSTIR